MASAHPLQWPIGRPRWNGFRRISQFKMSRAAMQEHLFDELERLGASDIVVSTNKSPYSRSEAEHLEDPGVAVYFVRKGQEIAIACDKYQKVSDNLHAIGLAVQAFRSLERHGTGEMVDAAFTGFKALPSSITTPLPHRDWWVVLDVPQGANALEVRAAYRKLLKLHHPDTGGSQAELDEVRRAYDEWEQL